MPLFGEAELPGISLQNNSSEIGPYWYLLLVFVVVSLVESRVPRVDHPPGFERLAGVCGLAEFII